MNIWKWGGILVSPVVISALLLDCSAVAGDIYQNPGKLDRSAMGKLENVVAKLNDLARSSMGIKGPIECRETERDFQLSCLESKTCFSLYRECFSKEKESHFPVFQIEVSGILEGKTGFKITEFFITDM